MQYGISEHEPRKGTETPHCLNCVEITTQISEHEPRKGTETAVEMVVIADWIISEHEPRKGTETTIKELMLRANNNFRTRTPKGDGNPKIHD